ncbi:MAG: glycosyltransferase family 61 protein [Hymenobacter sp.]|nr:MAG: glycosyltransferase family 61 protein [Hymenobacter sp.]
MAGETVEILPSISNLSPALPANVAQLPPPLAQFFSEKAEWGPRYLHVLQQVCVSWHAVIFKNFRLFLPGLAAPHWEVYYNNSYLLKQWLGSMVSATDSSQPMALVHDQWTRGNYYHWMVDALPRLLALRKFYPDAVVIMPAPMPGYVQQTARLLGFEHFFLLEERQVLNVQTLLVPEHVAPLGYHNPLILRQLRVEITSKLLPANAQPVPTRRIYVSRSRQEVRRLSNEVEVVKLLQLYDFESVYFEELSFTEQVLLMQNTAVLMGVHGANLVNLMFLPAGSHVIELVNEDKFLKLANANFENLIYSRMSSSLDLPYFVIPCRTLSGLPPANNADVEVTLADVEQFLQLHFPPASVVQRDIKE